MTEKMQDAMFTEERLRQKIVSACGRRHSRPLVPSITNYVTAEFVVNCQLALGASCAVVNMPDESCKIAERCDAFYINLGTILPVYADTIPAVVHKLHSAGRPWVLDPVAAGLGKLRTELLLVMKKYPPAVIRANASEIISLAQLWQADDTKLCGACQVDSVAKVCDAKQSAVKLAQAAGAVVAVSGEEDLITDGKTVVMSHGGSSMMEIVTGCGCALGGAVAFFCSFCEPFVAALCAVNAFNFAGRKAALRHSTPAGFKLQFIDGLYGITAEKIAHNPFEII